MTALDTCPDAVLRSCLGRARARADGGAGACEYAKFGGDRVGGGGTGIEQNLVGPREESGGGRRAAGTSAQPCQRGPLIEGAADLPSQVQGLPVAVPCGGQIAAGQVQGAHFSQRFGGTTQVAIVPEDAQRLAQLRASGGVVMRIPSHRPKRDQDAGLPVPVADVLPDAEGLNEGAAGGTVVPG